MARFRRIAFVAGALALLGAVLRLRGRGGRPPTGNGWRELDVTEGS